MIKIIFIFQTLLLLVAYNNCSGNMQTESTVLNSKEGTQPTYQTQLALKECQFIDVVSMSNILKNQLGISYGDVPIYEDENDILQSDDCRNINPETNDPNCYYLTTYAATLGVADLTNNIKTNNKCTSTKYKLATEIFLNACLESVDKPEISQKLFPNGLDNFDSLYLTFVGRKPFSREVEVLDELVKTVEPNVAKASACAVVASSFEAVSKL